MQSPLIHIVSRKEEIAELVKKTLGKCGYEVSSTTGDEISKESMNRLNGSIDCLIFDKDIDDDLKQAARDRLKEAKVICLPSLDSASMVIGDAEYMSEPFRLSELTKFINKMFELRK